MRRAGSTRAEALLAIFVSQPCKGDVKDAERTQSPLERAPRCGAWCSRARSTRRCTHRWSQPLASGYRAPLKGTFAGSYFWRRRAFLKASADLLGFPFPDRTTPAMPQSLSSGFVEFVSSIPLAAAVWMRNSSRSEIRRWLGLPFVFGVATKKMTGVPFSTALTAGL